MRIPSINQTRHHSKQNGENPTSPLDVAPIPIESKFSSDAKEKAGQIKRLRESVGENIKKQMLSFISKLIDPTSLLG